MANEQHWIFPPDVKPNVQKKIRSLRETTSQITSVEAELTKLKLQKAQLEKELERFRLKHSEVRLGPITRCPDEILLLLFQYYLDYDHSRIRRLLFVCKHWYDVVMNSPRLWARIDIVYALDLFPYKYCTSPSKIPYVIACHERSKGLPLDVDLFLYEFPSVEDYLKEELNRAAQEITDRSESDDIAGKFFEEEWDFSSKWIDNELSKTLNYIFGVNEVNMKRWRSLELSLPQHGETASTVWRRIRRSTLNLTKLEIRNIPFDEVEPELDQPDSPHEALIQHLAFEGIPEQVRACLGSLPTTLKSLEIIIDEPAFSMQLSSLSALANLRILTLHIKDLSAERPQLAFSQLDLQRLDALTLYALSKYIGSHSGDTKYIQLATSHLLKRLCMLQGATMRHIEWSLCGEKYSAAPLSWLIQQQNVNVTCEITVAPDKMEMMDNLKEWAKQQVMNAMQNISGNLEIESLMMRSGKRGSSIVSGP